MSRIVVGSITLSMVVSSASVRLTALVLFSSFYFLVFCQFPAVFLFIPESSTVKTLESEVKDFLPDSCRSCSVVWSRASISLLSLISDVLTFSIAFLYYGGNPRIHITRITLYVKSNPDSSFMICTDLSDASSDSFPQCLSGILLPSDDIVQFADVGFGLL